MMDPNGAWGNTHAPTGVANMQERLAAGRLQDYDSGHDGFGSD